MDVLESTAIAYLLQNLEADLWGWGINPSLKDLGDCHFEVYAVLRSLSAAQHTKYVLKQLWKLFQEIFVHYQSGDRIIQYGHRTDVNPKRGIVLRKWIWGGEFVEPPPHPQLYHNITQIYVSVYKHYNWFGEKRYCASDLPLIAQSDQGKIWRQAVVQPAWRLPDNPGDFLKVSRDILNYCRPSWASCSAW